MTTPSVSTLKSFPAPGSIPPVNFYNINGLAQWLNNNPQYKVNYSSTGTFRFLYPPEYYYFFSSIGIKNYTPTNVPLCSNVTTLSQFEAQKYNTQIKLFQKIYETNSNAYINYVSTGQSPMYYTFSSFQEKYEYNSAVQLINKLYPFQDMAIATNWIIPFPIGI